MDKWKDIELEKMKVFILKSITVKSLISQLVNHLAILVTASALLWMQTYPLNLSANIFKPHSSSSSSA
jgi:hypothetical protein